MNYFIVISNSLIILFLIINLIMIKLKKSIKDDEYKKIEMIVVDSINKLKDPISELIAMKNDAVLGDVLKTNKELFDIIKSLKNDYNNFVVNFKLENKLEKEELVDKVSIDLKNNLNDLKRNNYDSFEKLEKSVDKALTDIKITNKEKLDEINNAVNEKLKSALDERLKESFENVISHINLVNTAIIEIKGIANDVGSLKNALTNVKKKGILGEILLGNIIKDFLTSNQYVENYQIKNNSKERIEYAIKLPGTKSEPIYLPIDSKFPYEPYSKLMESENEEIIKQAKQTLRNNLLKYAHDVSEKYINVPYTTDFAIIFLPLEGLYLEALNMGLFEELQNKYKINLTGPTTFTAFISSLQMGFKTLMIQNKSQEVFKLLSGIKQEFIKFEDVLNLTQKKLNEASSELDKLVGTRTRLINKKLNQIELKDLIEE